MRQLLCSHFGAMTWKMLYFLMTTAVCLLSFRNEPWWPQQLGGEGAEEELWKGEPCRVFAFHTSPHRRACHVLKSGSFRLGL